MRDTRPLNFSPGIGVDLDVGGETHLNAAKVALDDVGDQPDDADVDERQERGVGRHPRAGVERRGVPTNPFTGDVMMVFDRLIFSSSSRACACEQLRLRQVELRLGRLIPRLGVVVGLASR